MAGHRAMQAQEDLLVAWESERIIAYVRAEQPVDASAVVLEMGLHFKITSFLIECLVVGKRIFGDARGRLIA